LALVRQSSKRSTTFFYFRKFEISTMVFVQSLIGLAVAGLAAAVPVPDSAIGDEVAVSAPYGVVMSDTAALASQTYQASYATATAMASAMYAPPMMASSAMYEPPMMASSSAMYEPPMMASSAMYEPPMMASSSAMYEPPMMASSSAMYEPPMMESTAMATSTAMASMSYATASYGSGSSNWGGSGYQDCVNQCIASFGTPGSYMPTATGSSMGSSGSGATHTVIVAPTQGVLRYVPFMVNASVGDTIQFMWGANNHTVTKGTALGVCNKSENALFTSGEHNKSFTFTQVVNDTNPTFFYCATPGHCEKGMFGIINPPMAGASSSSSVASMLGSMMSNNSDVSAMWSYTMNMTAGNPAAAAWGAGADMSNMPSWAQQAMLENVMYTRTFLAANPETLQSDGSVSLATGSNTPFMTPPDITAALNNASNSTSASTAASETPSSAAAAASPSTTQHSGARSVASSGAAIALTAGLAAFFLL